jgi:transcriptional regulator with XRE-family HTH domain
MQNRIFSEQLADLMRRRGVNQVTLAQAVGTSQSTISRALQGKPPKAEEVGRLADYFGVSTDVLLKGWDRGTMVQSIRAAVAGATMVQESGDQGNEAFNQIAMAEARGEIAGEAKARREIAAEIRAIVQTLGKLADRLDPRPRSQARRQKM